MIVSESYKIHNGWVNALHNIVIKGGDMKYLTDFDQYRVICKDTVLQLAER